MNSRNFDEWLSTFRESINGFDYYTDFVKVCQNAAIFRDEINILNLLVNAEDIESEFMRIIAKYPECFESYTAALSRQRLRTILPRRKCSYNVQL